MRTWVAILCGVVLLVLALVALAPAGLLEGRIDAMLGNNVRLANASGTLWNGSGELVLPTGERRPIAWKIDALPLLRGELRGSFGGNGDPASGTRFSIDNKRVELGGFKLNLPAETVLRSIGAPSLFSAAGDVSLQVDRALRDPGALDVQLAMQWRNASVAGPGASLALGDVTTELVGRGPQVTGPIANTGGEVEISGTVTAASEGPPRVDMVVRPRAGLDRDRATAIAGALSALGPPDAQGGYRIVWPRSPR
jgi:Type II secretion system (T2SS), protein N